MRYENDGDPSLELINCLGESLGSLRVKVACGLVKQQNARSLQKCASDGQTLLLAPRQTNTVLTIRSDSPSEASQ
jgi:hypothetical protein